MMGETTANRQGPAALRDGLAELNREISLGEAALHGRIGEISDRLGQLRAAAEGAGQAALGTRLATLAEVTGGWAQAGPADWPAVARELAAALAGLEPAGTTAPKPAAALGEDQELISDFLMESRDHLSQVETRVLDLEQDPGNSSAIDGAFRSFHTIKGLAGFLDLETIRSVTHEVETVLDRCRSGEQPVSSGLINMMLEAADFLAGALDLLEKGTRNPPLPVALLERIRASAEPGTAPAVIAIPSGEKEPAPLAAPAPGGAAAGERAKASSVKVDTLKLDHLVDMVGELVIAQSMVRHDPALAALANSRLMRNLSQLGRITDDLQKTAMSMRLVSLEATFRKMTRLVRDIALKTGKNVELDASGEETELDRNIVEALADPLLHMIRNAVDHGIESPEARRAAGKPEKARVGLKASYQAGYIQIEISDDGRGLNREKLAAKAVERGLVDDPAKLSDQEVFSLIFAPGFSTAEKVTDLSGRGVGMDVVKRQIQKLRGRIDITSTLGQGTTFILKLPLTLAIIDGLVVGVGRDRYIIPLWVVKEMMRPSPEMISQLEGGSGGPPTEMALIRDRLLPIVRLHECFNVPGARQDPAEALLIVCECEDKEFCLMVDDLSGKQEVVIKSLGELMRDTPGIAGGAILGDGRVGLILDVERIFRG